MRRAIYRLSPWTGQILAYIGVLLIFFPKINLISLHNNAAGIRLDDILLLGCQALFFAVFLYSPAFNASKFELRFASWVGILLISNGLNLILFHRSNPLYTLRFIEYFLFFYFGYYFSKKCSIRKLAEAVLWINGPIMILQAMGLVGGFASAGYVPKLDRAIGLTGGPWEIGVLINFCLAILLFYKPTKPSIWPFFITSGLLILTASRMAMLTNLIILSSFYVYRNHKIISVIWKSSVILAIVGCILVVVPNSLQARSANLFTTENFTYLQKMYDLVPDNPTTEGLYDVEVADSDSDLSWVMRARKWSIAVKLWSRNPLTMLFGIGPGTLGVALDGGWLRVLAETGIVGFLVFLSLGRSIWKISPTLRMMIVVISVNMLMIDIYISYKAMAFLFFMTGAIERDTAMQISQSIAPHRDFARRQADGGADLGGVGLTH